MVLEPAINQVSFAGGEFIVEFVTELFKNFALLFKRKFFQLLENLGGTHCFNLPRRGARARL